MALSSLQVIRARIKEKDKTCPKCYFKLTIEITQHFETEICENCLEHATITALSCCRTPDKHLVKMIIANGMIQVRKQCKSCGKVEGSSIGGLTQVERDKLPLADMTAKENWQDPRNTFYDDISKLRGLRFQKQREDDKDEWFKQYNVYLQSFEWKSKRDKVLKRDNYKCQCCLTGVATQVHHTSYDMVDFTGREPCFNLISICIPCHQLIHSK